MLAREIMKDSTKILRLAASGKLPDLVNESSGIDMDVFEELYHAGLLTGADACSDGGRCYLEPKITFAGREKLKQDQQESAPWWRSFDRRLLVLGIVVALIGVAVPVYIWVAAT
jgi:hypothetical protein|tara:strand:+ start:48 stop:389 length:342 start_codon:yes stop_codon:yes gene_type:complete